MSRNKEKLINPFVVSIFAKNVSNHTNANKKMIKKVIISTFIFTIRTIRPLLGPDNCCRFFVPCTDYAQEQLKKEPFSKAVWNIIKRVISCNPFSSSPYYSE